MGLGPVGAAAFLGNFLVETGWTVSPYADNGTGGYGIAQWTNGRWTNYLKWAKNQKPPLFPYSIWNQLQWVSIELHSTHHTVLQHMLQKYGGITSSSAAASNVVAAADYVMLNYEVAVYKGVPEEPKQREYEARFVLHELWPLA